MNRGEAVAVTTQLVNFILVRNVILDRAVKTARYMFRLAVQKDRHARLSPYFSQRLVDLVRDS